MAHYYKITKHPETGKFENAAWLDVGRFYYVAFPDGRMYNEKYCVWEFQEMPEIAIVEEEQLPCKRQRKLRD